MNVSLKLIAVFGSGLALAWGSAVAGNYAEGDPRASALSSKASAGEIAAHTRQWIATAPTVGYPEGDPRSSVQVTQKTRAQVNAEAVAWVSSGMSQVAYGEASVDGSEPSYRRAAQIFSELRASQLEQSNNARPQ